MYDDGRYMLDEHTVHVLQRSLQRRSVYLSADRAPGTRRLIQVWLVGASAD